VVGNGQGETSKGSSRFLTETKLDEREDKESTGVSLKEAKDAVEALECGESPMSPAETDDDMEAELLRLLRQGQKLQAVKIYKEQTGL